MNRILGKVASWKKELIIGSMIFLASSLSFSLGYLANREANHAPIIIEKCAR